MGSAVGGEQGVVFWGGGAEEVCVTIVGEDLEGELANGGGGAPD